MAENSRTRTDEMMRHSGCEADRAMQGGAGDASAETVGKQPARDKLERASQPVFKQLEKVADGILNRYGITEIQGALAA